MANSKPTTRFRFWLWLIAFIGVIVPRRLRAHWRREWEAELRHREELLTEWDRLDWRSKLDLLRRSASAFWDALWLQPKRLEDEMFQDLRFGLRMLLKNPGFTLAAVLTLALGIGANTAIFSAVHGVLLKPLPYSDPDQVVTVNLDFPMESGESVRGGDYLDWRDQSRSFATLACFDIVAANLTGSGEAERLTLGLVSASLFPLLGVKPLLGRDFHPEEDQAGGPRAVLLSHSLWRRRFGSDPGIIGKTLLLDGVVYRVVGVTASGDRFPGFPREVDAWAPLALNSTQERQREDITLVRVIGRLKPGVTIERAQADLKVITHRIGQAHPGMYAGAQVRISKLSEQMVRNARTALRAIWGAVAFVLLIACANVANLLLARAAARRKELAVRAAMGAGRLRLIRQLLTESILLSVLGGAIGLLLAWGGVRWLMALDPAWIPRVQELGVGGASLGVACLISILTGVIAGLLPAWQASQADLNEALKEGLGARLSTRKSWHRARPTLVVVELALSLTLLIGAGLMIKSFLKLLGVEKGFQAENVLTMTVPLSFSKYPPESPQRLAYCQELLARFQSLPGVQSAALTTWLPLTGRTWRRTLTIEGRPPWERGKEPVVEASAISPDYFRTMGMQMRAGRAFTEDDSAGKPSVVIINETLARRFFPGEAPLGKHLDSPNRQSSWASIVGVAPDVKHLGLDEEVKPETYFPYTQAPLAANPRLIVRANVEPLSLAAALRREVTMIDPDQPVFESLTMEQRLANSMALRRNGMLLFGVFAAVALIIAAIGVYGVISYSISQRTHEIGVRMALGAQAGDVLKLVMRHGLALALAGVASGMAGALALTRVMKTLLFDVSATDPVTFVSVSLLLAAVALMACYLPARRATKVDPMVALRHE